MKVHEKPCLLSDDTIAILQEKNSKEYPWTEKWAENYLETSHKSPLGQVLALVQGDQQLQSLEFPAGIVPHIMNRRSYTFGLSDIPDEHRHPVAIPLEPLCRIRLLFTWAYYGFVKPTLGEALAHLQNLMERAPEDDLVGEAWQKALRGRRIYGIELLTAEVGVQDIYNGPPVAGKTNFHWVPMVIWTAAT